MGGGFMAGQVIADLKFVEPLTALGARLDDLRRGLNRVVGRPVKAISPRSRSGGQETTAPARVPLTMEHAPCTLQDFSVALLE
jgi:hypothetical protein